MVIIFQSIRTYAKKTGYSRSQKNNVQKDDLDQDKGAAKERSVKTQNNRGLYKKVGGEKKTKNGRKVSFSKAVLSREKIKGALE